MSYESESIAALKIDVLTLNNEVNRLKRGSTVEHYQIGQKYKIVIERAASTKGIDGFKLEVNGDDFDQVQTQVEALYDYAKGLTNPMLSAIIDKKDSP